MIMITTEILIRGHLMRYGNSAHGGNRRVNRVLVSALDFPEMTAVTRPDFQITGVVAHPD